MTEWTLEKLFELADEDCNEITPVRRSNGTTVFVCGSERASRHMEAARLDYLHQIAHSGFKKDLRK